MIFTAKPNEQLILNQIPTNNYVLLRVTYTMISKNNIDANGLFRSMLKQAGIVDYEQLPHGGSYGVRESATFIEENDVSPLGLKFYRVNNNRGDRRFSIEHLKKKAREKRINEGDLLCIGFSSFLFVINLTHNTPSLEQITKVLGTDPIQAKLEEIKPKLKAIIDAGWHPNSKGPGRKAPKDVGDTFESLLKIPVNNYPGADIDGLIEIKTKQDQTKTTLFTLRPSFEGTPIEAIEPNYRSQVSAFTRQYGYGSLKHPGMKSLYVTISGKPNRQGLSLAVLDDKVAIRSKTELLAYWMFEDLQKQLEMKHPATIWVDAESKMSPTGTVQFRYKTIQFTKTPRFEQFLSAIPKNKVVYDWRGYVTPEGPYQGKNHGNAWRVDPKYRDNLFDVVELLSLTDDNYPPNRLHNKV